MRGYMDTAWTLAGPCTTATGPRYRACTPHTTRHTWRTTPPPCTPSTGTTSRRRRSPTTSWRGASPTSTSGTRTPYTGEYAHYYAVVTRVKRRG
ncbi:hypothetical protein ONE63_007124 [Megalurothrips usitatus]|uniref:Uncharacterized protein n=1 Tax=Megalurothrips usitatus TaxID=439358 RepID=A0AAV7XVW7_9NEOP|nr:hypothetical protein ONE63_007124 [Megalurothrips usitatus]